MASVKQIMDLAEDQKLIRKCRDQMLVYKRYYLFNELRKQLTLEGIARLFNMNHSTVVHGLRQHDTFIKMNDRIYINSVSDLFEKINEFNLGDLGASNLHLKIIKDEDSFVTMEIYLHTKHADLFRDNQGLIPRDLLKEML